MAANLVKYVGGLIGVLTTSSRLADAYALGDISVDDGVYNNGPDYVGGVVGQSISSILENVYS